METCVLIDGNSILYRMFYGVRPMTSPKGIPTAAIYGFMNILLKIKKEYDPEYMAVAFDLNSPTFRHEAYKDYKAGREPMPEELFIQQELIKGLLESMEIPIVEKAGYEADDILGTLSREAQENDLKTYILTGDRDAFQLVTPDIVVLYPNARSRTQYIHVTEQYIKKKYHLVPEELKTVKALMGDRSDNIPGVRGIGEKRALELVEKYGTLENLYDHIEDLKGKVRENLIEGKEDAYNSFFLGTIDCSVPLDLPIEDLKFKGFLNEESEKILKDLGFKSILSKLEEDSIELPKKIPIQAKKVSCIHISSPEGIQSLLYKINETLAYTVNYFQDNTRKDELYNAPDEGGPIYLAIETDGTFYFISNQEYIVRFIKGLTEIPRADQVKTYGHNLKKLEKIYNRFGSTISNLAFDIYLAAYLNDPSKGQYSLSSLAQQWLDLEYPSEEDLFGKKKERTLIEIGPEVFRSWMVTGCFIIQKITPALEDEIIADGMEDLYKNIEIQLEPVLAEMEETGFKIDVSLLSNLSEKFEEKLAQVEEEIFRLAVKRFNLASPQQLAKVLYEDIGLPVIKKTKTGYSTQASVLEKLRKYHPIVDQVLEWRQLQKLDSTYGKGLITYVDPQTDKIYSTFQQTVTTTGRISSTDPNLQNIPVKTEMGREIRKVFIASKPDRVLVDADYSQIELRVLAALSGDESLIQAFKDNQDVHKLTAAKIFNKEVDEVTSQERSYAKTINFGLIYGKQAFTLAV